MITNSSPWVWRSHDCQLAAERSTNTSRPGSAADVCAAMYAWKPAGSKVNPSMTVALAGAAK
jgi:hypothetical protein